jgi:protein TonB
VLTLLPPYGRSQPQPPAWAVSKHSSLLLLGSCVASFCLARLFFVASGYPDAPANPIDIEAPPLTRTAEAQVPPARETQTLPTPARPQPIDDSTAALPAAAPSAPPPAESQPSPSAPSDQAAADKTEIDAPKAEAEAPSSAAPSEEVAESSPPASDIDLERGEANANDPNAASPVPAGEAEPEAASLAGSDESTPDDSTAEAKGASTPDEKPITASPKKLPEPSRQARQIVRTKPGPRAMQLAPAAAPIGHATASGYGARVRSMLARHKPVAGARGSATVTFSIGRNGALRSVRVSQSSGSARIDQMALATVHGAAPFPAPPPNLAAGGLSYSIRIYFR